MRPFLAALLVLVSFWPAQADLLDDLAERGTFRMGMRMDAAPFSYIRLDGEPAGLAVALCRLVAESVAQQIGRSSLDVEFIPVDARERFVALKDGRTDLHCGPASATLGRRAAFDFSIPYFVDGAGAAIRKGSYRDIFDIREQTLGVLAGTTTEQVVADLVRRNAMQVGVQTFATHADGLTALDEGKIAAYFADQAILTVTVQQQVLSARIDILPEVFSFEPYALVMDHGEDRLRLAVDRALSEIYDSGQIYQLILAEMEGYKLTQLARAVYQIVGLPE